MHDEVFHEKHSYGYQDKQVVHKHTFEHISIFLTSLLRKECKLKAGNKLNTHHSPVIFVFEHNFDSTVCFKYGTK
jgi:hypothetical protein